MQDNLDIIYQWAVNNNMKWNDNKFQTMRIGKNNRMKEDTLLFTPKYDNVIEVKETIKDLRVLIDDDMRYNSQINSAISKANKKLGWVLRTFWTRSVDS